MNISKTKKIKKTISHNQIKHIIKPKTVQLYEGDGIEISDQVKSINYQCCNCKIIHKINFKWKRNSLIMRFYRGNDNDTK